MLLLALLLMLAGKARGRLCSKAQLVVMDRAQVILETLEGEGPRPLGNGRKPRKPILPTVQLPSTM